MAIKGPKGAHPTTRGWESAKGELLKSQKISEDQIAEWNNEMNPKPQVLREAPVTEEEVIEEHMEIEEVEEEVVEEPKKNMFGKLFS
jgi:hypothetical protein